MAQNAGWTDRAERVTVDAVQTNNIPIIDCSLAFAQLHDTFSPETAHSADPSPRQAARQRPPSVARDSA
eukprot:2936328-Pleurochrysis_carterae.AAC.1